MSVLARDIALLEAAGYTTDEINDMAPSEVRQSVQDALEMGVTVTEEVVVAVAARPPQSPRPPPEPARLITEQETEWISAGRYQEYERWRSYRNAIKDLLQGTVVVLFIASWLLMFTAGGGIFGGTFLHAGSGMRISGMLFGGILGVWYIANLFVGLWGADAAEDGRLRPFSIYVILFAVSIVVTPVTIWILESLMRIR